MPSIVFDSWALIAFFDDEPPAQRVEGLIKDADFDGKQLAISVVNVGEVWYNYTRIFSEEFADELTEKIEKMNFEIIPADWNLTKIAARFKAGGGIFYADCFAAALAKKLDAPLVTGDREFERIENEIQILWV